MTNKSEGKRLQEFIASVDVIKASVVDRQYAAVAAGDQITLPT
jgi:hypothetical protein